MTAAVNRRTISSGQAAAVPAAESSRIASLDGLRALSISVVLLSHLCGTRHFLGVHALDWLGDFGQLGVRVFFVISGFLITTILLRELEMKGRVSLGDFYVRRFFRIFPAYYVLLAIVGLCGYMNLVFLKPGDLLHAATYTSNYHNDHAWLLGHTWSLSVEEQFYVLWPVALYFGGKRVGMFVAAACLAISPLARTGIWFWAPDFRPEIGLSFPTVADSLATGCLLSSFRSWLGCQSRYMAWISSKSFLLVPVAAFAANMFGRSPRWSYPVGQTVTNIGIALSIDWSIRFASSGFGRFLNTRLLVWLGTLSYSLYLWQQPFLDRTASGVFQTFPFNLAAAFVTASASYYLVEKPFLAFRSRLASHQYRLSSAATIASPASPLP